jgi:rubrerythrin
MKPKPKPAPAESATHTPTPMELIESVARKHGMSDAANIAKLLNEVECITAARDKLKFAQQQWNTTRAEMGGILEGRLFEIKELKRTIELLTAERNQLLAACKAARSCMCVLQDSYYVATKQLLANAIANVKEGDKLSPEAVREMESWNSETRQIQKDLEEKEPVAETVITRQAKTILCPNCGYDNSYQGHLTHCPDCAWPIPPLVAPDCTRLHQITRCPEKASR